MNDDAHADLATLAALRAARQTRVLDALLDRADTPDAVAAATDVDAHAASVLLDVLTDRGFFEWVDGAAEPTNRALGLLTKTDLRSIGRRPHEIDRFDAYAALPTTISAADENWTPPTDDGRLNRLGYLQATPEATVHAAVTAALDAAPPDAVVLDVGGAPGHHATEFAARGHDVTLRDTPAEIDAASPLLEPRAITLDPGPLTSEIPLADLVFASDLTPRLDDVDLHAFLEAARDSLERSQAARNGDDTPALVLLEHVRGHSPNAATRRLDALATGEPGDCRTAGELRDALHSVGYEDIDVDPVPDCNRHAVVATPGST